MARCVMIEIAVGRKSRGFATPGCCAPALVLLGIPQLLYESES